MPGAGAPRVLSAMNVHLHPRSLLAPTPRPSPPGSGGIKGKTLAEARGETAGERGGEEPEARRPEQERSPLGAREALTFALFVRGLAASRRHLFAGCSAARLITLPAA